MPKRKHNISVKILVKNKEKKKNCAKEKNKVKIYFQSSIWIARN